MTMSALDSTIDRLTEPLEAGAVLMSKLMRRPFDLIDVTYTEPDSGQTVSLLGRLRALESRLAELERDPPKPDTAELAHIARSLSRLADALAPEPADIVDSGYIAGKLGCTVTWVAEMVRDGRISNECIVPGTGGGKPWKFYRKKIDLWIVSR